MTLTSTIKINITLYMFLSLVHKLKTKYGKCRLCSSRLESLEQVMLSCTRSLVESDEDSNEEQTGRLHIFGICTMVEIGEESLDIRRLR